MDFIHYDYVNSTRGACRRRLEPQSKALLVVGFSTWAARRHGGVAGTHVEHADATL